MVGANPPAAAAAAGVAAGAGAGGGADRKGTKKNTEIQKCRYRGTWLLVVGVVVAVAVVLVVVVVVDVIVTHVEWFWPLPPNSPPLPSLETSRFCEPVQSTCALKISRRMNAP